MPATSTVISLPLETILPLGFLVVLGVFSVFSAVLYYHWKEYATNARVIRLTLGLYFCTTIPLLCVMGIMTLAI